MGEVCENHQSAKPYFRLISGESIFGVFGHILAWMLFIPQLNISLESSLHEQHFGTKISIQSQSLGKL